MTQPLNRQFNVAVLHMANKLHPCGFNVSDVAPDTLEGINATR